MKSITILFILFSVSLTGISITEIVRNTSLINSQMIMGASTPNSTSLNIDAEKTILQNDSEKWNSFEKRNLNGCFVLYDTKNDNIQYYNKARCDSSYLPASTFKIINSLISLEEGAVNGVYDTINWDGINRNWENWNQDHCMASALKYSVVWFYQELARRVGRENMQKWIDSVAYGNQKLGPEIDKFWLQGDIRITANQQILFLQRLLNNELPFKKENQEIVKQIMLTDSSENYQVYSKTGWAIRAKQQIGWLVGYVVTKDNTWIFTLNMDICKDSDTIYRKEIVYEILKEEGIID
jgi:beta-lactamase class D